MWEGFKMFKQLAFSVALLGFIAGPVAAQTGSQPCMIPVNGGECGNHISGATNPALTLCPDKHHAIGIQVTGNPVDKCIGCLNGIQIVCAPDK